MSSETVLLINAIAYTLIAIFFFKKNKLSLGLFFWGFFCVSSWMSYLFIQQPMYSISMHAGKQTFLPCIYLLLMLYICIYPLVKIKKIENIIYPNRNALKIIIGVCILCQLLFFILDIPTIIKILTSSTELEEYRNLAYGKNGDDVNSLVVKNSIINRIHLLYAGMRPLAIGLSVVLLFVNTNIKNKKLNNIFAITTFLESVRYIIVQVGRGQMVITFCVYAITLFLIRDYLSSKIKKTIIFYGLPVLGLGVIFFVLITLSRFGDNAEFFMYKYMGEPMNNFNGILWDKLKDNTMGQSYFSVIFRFVLGGERFINVEERYEYMEQVTGIPPFIFYTYIGGLIIEFGKYIPIIIVLIINRLSSKIKTKGKINLFTVILYIFLSYFYTYGVFTFPIPSFDMFILLYVFIFYLLFGRETKKIVAG